MKIKRSILAWLLHHANREINQCQKKYFYEIKNGLLMKYGRLIGYEIQFIEGKRCNACVKGIYRGWNFEDICWHCGGTTWYKRPVWNSLALYQFGNYYFHQPKGRTYEKPDTILPIIEGYINHSRSKHGSMALFVLFLLYEKGYLIRWWNSAGTGYYPYWRKPFNFINNIIHIFKKGQYAIPLQKMRRRIMEWKTKKELSKQGLAIWDDELPF